MPINLPSLVYLGQNEGVDKQYRQTTNFSSSVNVVVNGKENHYLVVYNYFCVICRKTGLGCGSFSNTQF